MWSIKALGWALALPAALLWLVVGYLALIEVAVATQGTETEHSPLLVLLIVLPVAVGLTGLACRTRQRSRRG